MSDNNTVSVTILDKEYQVTCPPEEVEALTASARFLNQQMNDIRSSGKVVGLDRIAVMAALNIANEYLNSENTLSSTKDSVTQRIASLNDKVASALAQQKQLEL